MTETTTGKRISDAFTDPFGSCDRDRIETETREHEALGKAYIDELKSLDPETKKSFLPRMIEKRENEHKVVDADAIATRNRAFWTSVVTRICLTVLAITAMITGSTAFLQSIAIGG